MADLDERLRRLERSHNQLNGLVNDLRDAVMVTAHVQARQAHLLKDMSEHLVLLDQSPVGLRDTVDEVTDKLNGLSGYLDGLRGKS